MRQVAFQFLMAGIGLVFMQCGSTQNGSDSVNEVKQKRASKTKEMKTSALPNVFIYKTKNDYSNQIAVTMDEAKEEIISYPDPSDIDPETSKPVQLGNGYLLDNQGINFNSVFIDYTFEEYAALNKPPSISEMKTHILDKDPFLELWQCGNRQQYENIEMELKQKVKEGLKDCAHESK